MVDIDEEGLAAVAKELKTIKPSFSTHPRPQEFSDLQQVALAPYEVLLMEAVPARG